VEEGNKVLGMTSQSKKGSRRRSESGLTVAANRTSETGGRMKEESAGKRPKSKHFRKRNEQEDLSENILYMKRVTLNVNVRSGRDGRFCEEQMRRKRSNRV
jgi:hypothetical protein